MFHHVPNESTIKIMRSSMFGYLQRHFDRFTSLIERTIQRHDGKGRPIQEYMGEIKRERVTVFRRQAWF